MNQLRPVSILLGAALVGMLAIGVLAWNTLRAPAHAEPQVAQRTPMLGQPFNGVPVQRRGSWAVEAAENYRRLLRDQPPAGSCKDAGAFSDGGTQLWECAGYNVRLQKSLASIGGENGVLYGPVLTVGEEDLISHVEFYTYPELQQRLAFEGGR